MFDNKPQLQHLNSFDVRSRASFAGCSTTVKPEPKFWIEKRRAAPHYYTVAFIHTTYIHTFQEGKILKRACCVINVLSELLRIGVRCDAMRCESLVVAFGFVPSFVYRKGLSFQKMLQWIHSNQ